MSLIYYPLCGGTLVALSNKIFENNFLIEEIAIEIAQDEETANNKANKHSFDLNNSYEENDIEA